MSTPQRDSQFAGFAKLLMDELLGDAGYIDVTKNVDHDEIAEYEQIIARRAYDLACHTVKYTGEDTDWLKGKGYTASQIVENDIPDMTELPKEQE